jgi:hypothetical protein
MRNDSDGYLEFLVEHKGKWLRVFGNDGPGPAARDTDQNIDHMIHAGGVRNLIDHGSVRAPINGRAAGKPDRRTTERRAVRRQGVQREPRADKRRVGDKLAARLAARKR